MVIYGWKTYVQVLAVLQLVCGQCGNASEHVLRKLTTKFTLFFIPLFPINKKRTLFCPACEHEQRIPAAQAEQLMATGGMPTQGTHDMLGATPGMPAPGMHGPMMQGPVTPPGMPVPMAGMAAGPGAGVPGMPGHPGMPGPAMGSGGFRAPGPAPSFAGPVPMTPQGMPMLGPGTPPPGMPPAGQFGPGPYGAPPQGPPPGYPPQPPYPPPGYPPHGYGPR